MAFTTIDCLHYMLSSFSPPSCPNLPSKIMSFKKFIYFLVVVCADAKCWSANLSNPFALCTWFCIELMLFAHNCIFNYKLFEGCCLSNSMVIVSYVFTNITVE